MREFWSGTWAAMESRQITLAVKINFCTGNESSKIVHYTVFFAENGLGTFNTGVAGNIPLHATVTAGPIAGVMNVLTFNEGTMA